MHNKNILGSYSYIRNSDNQFWPTNSSKTTYTIENDAFPDFSEFKRHIDSLVWETEVWIENNLNHIIHLMNLSFLLHIGAYRDMIFINRRK